MARPATGRNGQRVQVYLHSVTLAAAKKRAVQLNLSFSEYLNGLMRRSQARAATSAPKISNILPV